MLRVLSFISKVIGALILGLFIATVWFGNDERCSVLLHNHLQKTFKEQFGAAFHGRVKWYTFFPLAAELEQVDVRALEYTDEQQPVWQWKAGSMKVQLSMLSYFYSGAIDMEFFLKKVHSSSMVQNGYPVIMQHIKSMIMGVEMNIPTVLKSVSVIDVHSELIDEQRAQKVLLDFDMQVKKIRDTTVIRSVVKQGSITYNGITFIDTLHAKVQASVNEQKQWKGSLQGFINVPLLEKDDQKITLEGTWHHERGDIKCFNDKKTVLFLPVSVFLHDGQWYIEGQGTIRLPLLARCLTQDKKINLDGAVHVNLQGSLQAGKGILSCTDIKIGTATLDRVIGAFSYADSNVQGTVDCVSGQQHMHGTWQVTDHASKASCDLENVTDCCTGILKYWYCKAHNATLQATWDRQQGLSSTYVVTFNHQKLDTTITSDGALSVADGIITVKGTIDDQHYTVRAKTDPFALESMTYDDMHGKRLGAVTYDHRTHHVAGTLDYEVIDHLVYTLAHVPLPGSGTLTYKGTWQYPLLTGTLHFKEGVARVAGWYNYIADLYADLAIDLHTLQVKGKDCSVRLHKGSLQSTAWAFQFDVWQGVTWAHIPWSMKDCFINWKKDLYAVLSGSFVIQKQKEELALLQGFLSLDRAQLRTNIFSLILQKNVLPTYTQPFDMMFDVHVFSKQPVNILASVVEAKAALNLDVQGALSSPQLQGKITLTEGTLNFPAYPLQIARCSLTFFSYRLYDPLIELIAQNRIKKYLLTLAVSGTVQDPHIALQASPPLSEQQILLLLFGGSEEESFRSMIPALLMRNIETLLFGTARPLLSPKLPSWLEPLRKVTFIPQFTDQTARGGFKGAIEIEVSKRLRAIIEKNFSLTEDTAVKVDYLLSDDVSLRAVRDARGDLGASVEMRLKF